MFGMGTGGSLRLLSPEIWGCQGPCSLCFLPRSRASLPFRLRTRFARALLLLQLPFRFACLSLAPSKPHRSAFALLRPTKTSLRYSLRHSSLRFLLSLPASLTPNHFHGPRFRSQVPDSAFASPVPCSLFPVPLFPRSSPRPISITKLHTLLHFHR